MRRSKWAGWVLAAVFAVAALSALAQQDEGPILLPKPKPAAKPAATLLVMCDLACNWKLDGEAKGRIDAGGAAKAKVELGEHLVVVTTEDGLDKVQQLTEAKAAGQKVVSLELQPVRDARLKAEQEARDKAAREERDKAAREQQEKEQERQERAARDEAAKLIWTDPETGLMWTRKDNGSNVTWRQAMDYCENLYLAGHSGWRLPTIDELQDIYDPNANVGGRHVKGNMRLSGWEWSRSEGDAVGKAWAFGFGSGRRYPGPLDLSNNESALCVRRPGE